MSALENSNCKMDSLLISNRIKFPFLIIPTDDDPRLIRSPQLIQTKKIKEEEEESETNTSPKDIPRISGTMLDSKYSDGGISRYYSNGHPNGIYFIFICAQSSLSILIIVVHFLSYNYLENLEYK